MRRQFGRTHRYLSLDRPDLRQRALGDPVAFLAEHAAPAIVDEIQYAPELLAYVKHEIDEDRRPGRWLFTGSQTLALMRGVSETLAGRIAVVTLDPLAVTELPGSRALTTIDARIARVFGDRATSPKAANGSGDCSWGWV